MPQASAAGPGTLLSATRIDRLDAVTPGPAQRRGLQGLPRLHIDEPDAPPDEALSVLPGTFLETKVQVSVEFQDCFQARSEEHTSELQSLMRISYAVFFLKKKNRHTNTCKTHNRYQ